MDISSFSDDNFDTKAWINDILKNAENQDKKENYTMSIVMKLQLYVQQVNNALEETSQQVLMCLPKIIRDTKNLHQEASVLKEKMSAVRSEIVQIEQETGNSINNIERLDRIKTELELAKQGLHESDNWTVLVNDLEEVFDSKNIENISTKIIGMQKSLQLLVNVSDYEDRRVQLEGLKNRLEAIASPAIVQAFTSNNTEQSSSFVRIFKAMGRSPQLLKYYHKCQRDVLLTKWRNQLEIEQDESVLQWIHNFYDILISNWHTQQKWFNQVFTNRNGIESFMEIYTDVLTSLDPTLNECTDAALKQTEDKLNFLYEVKQIAKQFSRNLFEMIEPTPSKLSDQKLVLLSQSIYNHLMPYTGKYAAYEQAFLMKKLSTINCMKEELSDTIQALGLGIPQLMDIACEAKKRCLQITENCGYCGLIIALRAFLVSYADQYRVALRQIDRMKRQEEDWGTFQLCLSLLQNTGEMLVNLQQLEKDLTSTILENNQLKDGSFEYKVLLLSEVNRKEYESLVKCVTEGTQLSMLDQVTTEFTRLCSDIHHTTYQVAFAPIAIQLDVIQAPKTWAQFSGSTLLDLPDYSFSPQEYITQIGQYLMTLPQHLEPFLFRENPSLSCALKAVDQEYTTAPEAEGALAHVFLTVVARGTCQGFCDRILSICQLSPPASRQLAHDIGYLNNVLQDLGISLSENLQQLATLLKLPTEQYHTGSSGCSARYVAAVRQMRNITSN